MSRTEMCPSESLVTLVTIEDLTSLSEYCVQSFHKITVWIHVRWKF